MRSNFLYVFFPPGTRKDLCFTKRDKSVVLLIIRPEAQQIPNNHNPADKWSNSRREV